MKTFYSLLHRRSMLPLFILFTCLHHQLIAQERPLETHVITASEFHITRPLTEIFAEHPVDPSVPHVKGEMPDKKHRKAQEFPLAKEGDPVFGNAEETIQHEMGEVPGLPTKVNWAGQTPGGGFRPYDPSGAVGPNHYIQMINSTTFNIYNKSTGAIMLSGILGNLWSPATGNNGDPIVMYDRAADRWFLSQFGNGADKKIYIAISQTSNPLGAWYTYTFVSPQFPDYLKFGVWHDAYYMTSNQSTQKVFAFNRAELLAGTPGARSISVNYAPPVQAGWFFCPLPADAADATSLPSSGTPCPILSYSDNGWGAGYSDAINIYNMAVNWGAAPVTATITLAANVATSAFDASYDAGWNDCVQPGTAVKLDGIGGVLMYRSQWRSWAGYNTLVLNWGVKISATQRSIRWCELRQNQATGVWSMYQQGTYTPDTDTRWMGSIAMNDAGSIGLSYMKSNSSSVYPGLYYTGRRACDPLGTMTIAETLVAAGTGSQTSTNRVGDYAQMTVDPSDGITFWSTCEYFGGATGGSAARTRIFSFPLGACATAGVSIAITGGSNPICDGSPVTFTATPTNGGTTPSYQWKVNTTNVGTNSPTYTSSTLNTGDMVSCIMTSNLPGVLGNPATSNAITMTVSDLPQLGSTNASPSLLCQGVTTTITYTQPSCITDTGFVNTYAPANWVLSQSNANGAVNTSAPVSIAMVSGNNSSGTPGQTNYAITVPCTGTISFNWSYSTVDGPNWDYPMYSINGGANILMPGYSTAGASVQSGTASIPVNAGDVFRLVAYSVDNAGGSCTTIFSNFIAPTVPLQYTTWYDAPTGGNVLSYGNSVSYDPTTPGNQVWYASIYDNVGGCTNPSRVPVYFNVNALPTVTVSTSNALICQGDSAQLSSSVTFDQNYSLKATAFVPPIPTGAVTTLASGGVASTPLSFGSLDDGVWNSIPLPFTFNYYGNNFTTLGVSTNGFISFNTLSSSFCCIGGLLPGGTNYNVVALAWEDWLLTSSGTLEYFTNGTAPNRKFVVRAIAVPRFGGTGAPTSGSIVLNESDNSIEFQVTSITCGPADLTTMGIQNGTATLARTLPGRNQVGGWTASNEAWRFAPNTINYAWTPFAGLSSGIIANPLAAPVNAVNYILTVTDGNSCDASASLIQNVSPAPVLGTVDAIPSNICLGGTVPLTYNAPAGPACFGVQQTGFANTYAPANWTLLNTNSNGSVNVATAPDSIALISSNNSSGSSGTTDYSITIPCSGVVSFNWVYTTVDGPLYDRPQYAINGGIFDHFPGYDYFGSSSQNGSFNMVVSAGDVLTLRAYSTDNVAGPCTIIIKSFIAPAQSATNQYVYWYDAPTGGSVVATTYNNTAFYVPQTAGTYVYYAEVYNASTACKSLTRIPTNPVNVHTLPTVAPTASPSTICAGDSSQLTANAIGYGRDSLFTTLLNNNGFSGNAFNIIAAKTITIQEFEMHITTGSQAEVWYKPGGYGNAALTSSAGWTKLGSTVNITPAGLSQLTRIPVNASVTIPVGQTYGFVVVANGNVNYTNGSAVGAVYASNADVSITEGHGGSGIGGAFNFLNSPRVWNGRIKYTVEKPIVNYTWTPPFSLNNAAIANPKASPSTATIYQVSVTDANSCTATGTVNLYVNATNVAGTATASPANICLGSNVSLSYATPPGQFCLGAYQTGFAGTYAPANWVLTQTNSNGSVNTATAPSSISMVSSNGLSGPGTTSYSINIPCDGIVSFDWSYTSVDGPQYDYPRYSINGGIPQVFPGYNNLNGASSTQSGTFNMLLTAGQSLALQVYSVDNVFGSCTVVISNFKAPYQTAASQTVTWYNSPVGGLNLGSGNPQTITPAVPGSFTYYAQVTNVVNGCVNTSRVATNVVVVNPIPNVAASASPSTICIGTSTTLTGTGAGSYVWQPGGMTGSAVLVSPVATTTYTVTGTGAGSCTKTATVTVTVNTLPVVGTTVTNATICAGQSTSITGTGANTYTWNPGGLSGTTINVSPAVTTTYTVTGTNANGCTATAARTITVNSLPTVGAGASPATVCAGASSTLTGTGAITYAWNPGAISGNPISVSPATTTTYTVTGTNANGCTNTSTVSVTVNTLPLVGTTVTNATICAGTSTSITGTGASTYTWQPGALSGTTINVSPATTTTYTVTGTNANGCTATATRTITVNSLPSVGTTVTNAAICVGQSTSITGTGASSYTWQPGALSGTTINVSPATTTTYTVTGTSVNGCTATATRTITVNPLPAVGTTVTNATICSGAFTSITGTGAVSYTWQPGALSGTTINVSPATTTTYTVTGTNANGCTATATRTITVNPLPTVGTTVTNATICSGSSTSMTGTGAVTYIWNPGALSGTTVNVSPAGTTTYTVIGTNANGCTATATRTITVNTPPTVGTTATATSIPCGGSTTLTGTGASTYTWQPGGLSGTSVTVSPATTTTYTVTGTGANGCTATSTRTITVAPCGTTVNVKLFIEGYYKTASGLMEPVLLNQGVAGASGTQTDSITVELRNSVAPFNVITSQKVILNTNGTAVCNFNSTGPFYLAIKHRNALQTWSANPITLSGGSLTYDFSNLITKAYGSNQVMVNPGVFAFFSGDMFIDENIDLADLSVQEVDINNFAFGYYATDLNGDGNVDILDSPVVEGNVNNFVFSAHP